MTMRSANRSPKCRILFAVVGLGCAAVQLPGATMAKQAGPCSAGLDLHLSAPALSQGSVLLVEIKSATRLVEVKGEWDGRSVPFWQEAGQQALEKGLVGVDLEQTPGEYELKVTAQTPSGEKV